MKSEEIRSRAKTASDALCASDFALVPPGTEAFPSEPTSRELATDLNAMALARDIAELTELLSSYAEQTALLSLRLANADIKLSETQSEAERDLGTALKRDGSAVLSAQRAGMSSAIERLKHVVALLGRKIDAPAPDSRIDDSRADIAAPCEKAHAQVDLIAFTVSE